MGSKPNTWDRNLKEGLSRENHDYFDIDALYGPETGDIIETRANKFLPTFLVWFTSFLALHNLIVSIKVIKNLSDVRNTDLIVLNHHGEPSFPTAKFLSIILDIPIIYCSHTSLSISLVETHNIFRKGSLASKLIYKSDILLHKSCDKTLALTPSFKQKYIEYFGLSEENYSVMYVGFEEEKFEVEPAEVEDINAVYWGNFLPHHGVDHIIDAAKELEDVKFALVGSGGKRDHLMKQVENEQIENVIFPGFVPLSELVGYIKEADIALGTFEKNLMNDLTIGTKVAEACYFAKPIITAECSGIKDLFDHDENIITVNPSQSEDLAAKIDKYIDKKEDLEKIGTRAGKIYNNHFSPEANAEKLLNIYRKIEAS